MIIDNFFYLRGGRWIDRVLKVVMDVLRDIDVDYLKFVVLVVVGW